MQYPNFMPYFIYSQPIGNPQCYPMYYMPVMQNIMVQPAQPQMNVQQENLSKSIETSQELPFKSCSTNYVEKNQTENSEEIHTNIIKPKQKQGKKKINLLQKSTNIQKNYAKAIVSYSCGQRLAIMNNLGKKKGVEFLKLITSLKNKLKNISHIKNYTQKESFLSMFRILGNKFMKHEAVSYIYHSNIQQKSCHLKNMKLIQQNLLKC